MPLVAINTRTGQRVVITEYKDPRTELKSQEYVCQLCGGEMFLRAGRINSAHFAHKAVCNSAFVSHPESAEHLAGKRYLADYLRRQYSKGGYAGTTVEFEVPIQSAGRVADLLVTFPTGWQVAHEIQLAAITVEKLEERTNDYKSTGIDTIWWLGKSADTENNRTWSIDMLGQVGNISFSVETEHVDALLSGR